MKPHSLFLTLSLTHMTKGFNERQRATNLLAMSPKKAILCSSHDLQPRYVVACVSFSTLPCFVFAFTLFCFCLHDMAMGALVFAMTFIPLFKSGIHFLGEGDSGYFDMF